MTVPKCTSWFGHKFEPRYSKSPATGWPKFETSSAAMAEMMMDATRTITYHCDICVRCGHVIERKP